MADDLCALIEGLDPRETALVAARLLAMLEGGSKRAAISERESGELERAAARALIEAAVSSYQGGGMTAGAAGSAYYRADAAPTAPESYMTLRREAGFGAEAVIKRGGGMASAETAKIASLSRHGMEAAAAPLDAEAVSLEFARDARRFDGAFERY